MADGVSHCPIARSIQGDCLMPHNQASSVKNTDSGPGDPMHVARPVEPPATGHKVERARTEYDVRSGRRQMDLGASSRGRRGSRLLRHVPTTIDVVANVGAWLAASLAFSNSSGLSQTLIMAFAPTLSLIVLFR
jgi:hypothetical protein